jgi:hypothetical protein
MWAVGFPIQLSIWLLTSFVVVGWEKSDHYVEAAAVTTDSRSRRRTRHATAVLIGVVFSSVVLGFADIFGVFRTGIRFVVRHVRFELVGFKWRLG